MQHPSLFQSFFIGGFECSTHRLQSGKRLDLIAQTGHDQHILADYQRLCEQNIFTARDGLRWHLIETAPYRYDFTSVLPMLRAARETGVQVIWDLFHYGWPDDLDIFQPEFVHRFRAFAAAFAELLATETETTGTETTGAETAPLLSPVNEISYFAWAAGDTGYFNPFAFDRGYELKVQLARASIEATEAIWEVLPAARIVHPDPVINVIPRPERPEDQIEAENYRLAQYQAWDMISGRRWPLLGGADKYLDIVGVNYYDQNQWLHGGEFLDPSHPLYRPFSDILLEVYNRYGRPLFISETGVEGDQRPEWLSYICDEVRTAIANGVPVEGICLYPICDYPGWDDERYCHTGLWDFIDETGDRELHTPLAEELQRQQAFFTQFKPQMSDYITLADVAQMAADDKPPTTICLFTDSSDPSGMGEHMLTLATELCAQSDYEVLFVCPPGEKGDGFLKRADALGCTALPLAAQGSRSATQSLQSWLRKMDVDVFHCHAGIGWEGHDGIRAAHEEGVAAIVRTEHLPYLLTDPRQCAEHAAILEMVDQLICVSEAAAQTYLQAGIDPEKVRVVRNGIHPQRVAPDRDGVRAEFGLDPKAKLVLTVARMTEQKGHRYLLDALPAILDEVPDAHFLWVGQGPLEQELRRQMKTLQIDPQRLILAGRRNDVPRLLAAADLFALPSLFEGLPLVLLEAMANNLPIVATRVCGTSEAIRDGWNGRLVEAEDSAALAPAIVEALTQPALTARWTHAGRTRFEREFSAARMAGETVACYEALRKQENQRYGHQTNGVVRQHTADKMAAIHK